MSLICRPATVQDLPSWLELVPEVEPLFGPMPDFADHAERGIGGGTALVVVAGTVVHGAALLSRDDKPHHISWLAVRQGSRRSGVGTILMEAILKRWSTGDIDVVTFGNNNPGGVPARRYYERFGFRNQGATRPAPDGGARDLYLRVSRQGPAL